MNRFASDTDRRFIEVAAEPQRSFEKADVFRRAAIGLALTTAALLGLGVLASLFVFDGAIGRAEADSVGWIADNRIGTVDPVATIVSTLSDTWTVFGVIAGAVSMLWVSGHSRAALTVALGVSIQFLAFLAVGTAIDRTRPDVEPLHSVPSTSSFPSGHTAAAFVLYGTLVLAMRSVQGRPTPRALWLVPTIIATVVAAARVYEGVHYPSDVIAGFVLGVLALIAAGRATETVATHGWLDVPFRRIDRFATGPTAGASNASRTEPPAEN